MARTDALIFDPHAAMPWHGKAGPHVITTVRDDDELAQSNFLETLDAATA